MEDASSRKDLKDDSPSKEKDNLFDPSVDMLVNDFDDERTLEEEEALAAGESQDPSAELSNLQKVKINYILVRNQIVFTNIAAQNEFNF